MLVRRQEHRRQIGERVAPGRACEEAGIVGLHDDDGSAEHLVGESREVHAPDLPAGDVLDLDTHTLGHGCCRGLGALPTLRQTTERQAG